MRLYSSEARTILTSGGRLRKSYWNPGDHMIMHGVWFFRSTNVFTSRSQERLTLNGIDYQLYPLSYDSIFISEWEEVITTKNRAGFGLDF